MTLRKVNKINNQPINGIKSNGGLGKRKAKQGRFFYLCSTRKMMNPVRFTCFYICEIVGIDSS